MDFWFSWGSALRGTSLFVAKCFRLTLNWSADQAAISSHFLEWRHALLECVNNILGEPPPSFVTPKSQLARVSLVNHAADAAPLKFVEKINNRICSYLFRGTIHPFLYPFRHKTYFKFRKLGYLALPFWGIVFLPPSSASAGELTTLAFKSPRYFHRRRSVGRRASIDFSPHLALSLPSTSARSLAGIVGAKTLRSMPTKSPTGKTRVNRRNSHWFFFSCMQSLFQFSMKTTLCSFSKHSEAGVPQIESHFLQISTQPLLLTRFPQQSNRVSQPKTPAVFRILQQLKRSKHPNFKSSPWT